MLKAYQMLLRCAMVLLALCFALALWSVLRYTSDEHDKRIAAFTDLKSS